MVTRAQVVAAARGWIGTPFHHQAAIKGVGCDCGGLVRGVQVELGLVPEDYWSLPEAAAFHGYSRNPDGHSLRRACETFLDPTKVDLAKPGDVFLLKWAQHPQHVGFFADYRHGGLALIHALPRYMQARDGVVEHRMDSTWRGRIVAAFRLRGLEDA